MEIARNVQNVIERCNFPGQTVPSMEACGMDVFATVRNNGLEIHTLRVKGEPQNHFGLILVGVELQNPGCPGVD